MDSETSAAMVHVFEAEVATLHAVGKGMTAGRSSLTIVFDLASVDYVASAFMRLCLIAVRKAGKGGFSIITAHQKMTPAASAPSMPPTDR
jgi:hypothetical protein